MLEPTTEPWGQRTCYIADPEGNLIEIGSFNKSFLKLREKVMQAEQERIEGAETLSVSEAREGLRVRIK